MIDAIDFAFPNLNWMADEICPVRDDRMRPVPMKQIVKKTVGVVFIVLGFLALITPLSPGSWLILIGLELLGLRLLLENRLRRWAASRPGSRAERVIRRLLRVKAGESASTAERRRRRGAS